MANCKSMQIFFSEEVSEQDVLALLGTALGFLIGSTDVEVPGALGFAQVTSYSQGYKQGMLISWPNNVELRGHADETIKRLARHFRVRVLLEPDEDQADWLVAHPDGTVSSTAVDYLDDGIDVAMHDGKPD